MKESLERHLTCSFESIERRASTQTKILNSILHQAATSAISGQGQPVFHAVTSSLEALGFFGDDSSSTEAHASSI
jgi:hypothetical protein